MRRLKAIYLIPVVVILLIGAGVAAYYMLLSPQMTKVKTAQESWTQARNTEREAEKTYQSHLDAQVQYSEKLYLDYSQFHIIQNTMPAILNMKDYYTNPDEGLIAWYKIMGTGRLISELSRWVNGYKLPVTFSVQYAGPLPLEDPLPTAKLVEVDFGVQTIKAKGLNDLLQQLRAKMGYKYFPLIIQGEGDGKQYNITRLQDGKQYNPKVPTLTTTYTAKGYFMTRGWDPNGANAKADVDQAKALVANPPKIVQPRVAYGESGPPPTLLWFIALKDVDP